MVRISDENNISKLIITQTNTPREFPDFEGAYVCDEDACLFSGCTHASQCLFGSCTIKYSYTNTIHEVPFNNHTVGLCRYDTQYNITECDAVYIKPTVFREHRSYMHCGKLSSAPCKTNDECAYDKCIDGTCRTLHDGPSDADIGVRFIALSYLIIMAILLTIIYIFYYHCYIHKPQHRKKILIIASITTFVTILFLIIIY